MKPEELKKEYDSIVIPEDLEWKIRKMIQQGERRQMRKKQVLKIVGAVAAVMIVFSAGVNGSPGLAKAVEEIPLVGGFAKLITVKNYFVEEKTTQVSIVVPKLEQLENKKLEEKINTAFLEDGQKSYSSFMEELEEIKAQGGGNFSVNQGYEVITDTENILSVLIWKVSAQASSMEERRYYTLDKQREIILSLPELFKDKSYIAVISENIKEQMKKQMEEDESKIYFIDSEMPEDDFSKIAENQQFYINGEGNLVISFDEYQVAPGYMGAVEFEISKEAIENIISETYPTLKQ